MQLFSNICNGLRSFPYNLSNLSTFKLRNPTCRIFNLSFSANSRYKYGNSRYNTYNKNKNTAHYLPTRIAANRRFYQAPKHDTKRNRGYAYSLFAILVVTAACSTVVYFQGHPHLADISHVIVESILNSHRIQNIASKFAEEVVKNVLNDQQIQELAAERLKSVILESQTILEDILFKVLNSQETLDCVTRVSKDITNQLCNDPYIQEQVGHLLLMSINTEAAVTGASKWVIELFDREEIKESIVTLFAQNVLSDVRMQNEALQFCKNVGEEFLSDKKTLDESLIFLKGVLDSPSIHNHLSKTLWEVFKITLYPRWLCF
ncbi:hypothetical protein BEWA_043010 [Theileria equi strain WA]|uniref:Uncharacterized protein n=1 Tax=Theileria equi strain WA TaxID=1537102 RepID=L1LG93_THEEQ|nr:hypothetical protein BEWA_043010 [Theileria equi strain WA]EKX74260.1 hypothetical protein BEWA_043010 [Theileria equi strain WA]|eukprot:XP_004833712.1 hypothetical protein BEWA_043010 [Theileria equi strain WA]